MRDSFRSKSAATSVPASERRRAVLPYLHYLQHHPPLPLSRVSARPVVFAMITHRILVLFEQLTGIADNEYLAIFRHEDILAAAARETSTPVNQITEEQFNEARTTAITDLIDEVSRDYVILRHNSTVSISSRDNIETVLEFLTPHWTPAADTTTVDAYLAHGLVPCGASLIMNVNPTIPSAIVKPELLMAVTVFLAAQQPDAGAPRAAQPDAQQLTEKISRLESVAQTTEKTIADLRDQLASANTSITTANTAAEQARHRAQTSADALAVADGKLKAAELETTNLKSKVGHLEETIVSTVARAAAAAAAFSSTSPAPVVTTGIDWRYSLPTEQSDAFDSITWRLTNGWIDFPADEIKHRLLCRKQLCIIKKDPTTLNTVTFAGNNAGIILFSNLDTMIRDKLLSLMGHHSSSAAYTHFPHACDVWAHMMDQYQNLDVLVERRDRAMKKLKDLRPGAFPSAATFASAFRAEISLVDACIPGTHLRIDEIISLFRAKFDGQSETVASHISRACSKTPTIEALCEKLQDEFGDHSWVPRTSSGAGKRKHHDESNTPSASLSSSSSSSSSSSRTDRGSNHHDHVHGNPKRPRTGDGLLRKCKWCIYKDKKKVTGHNEIRCPIRPWGEFSPNHDPRYEGYESGPPPRGFEPSQRQGEWHVHKYAPANRTTSGNGRGEQ
ncbi:hypothetical protein H9P43_005443 [Blastocladiella emersonii ATCC 22665]|nr:hypothetical protein H9P43_005443 [Blastocladiella emersonii ATCC 22665]